MALFGFGTRRPAADQGAREAIVAWVRHHGGLADPVVVKASEIVCADPVCPGTETVILILAPGRPTRAVKVARPMPEVTEADVIAALAGEGAPSEP
ncbi:hypothetical protein ASF49_01385 [Methylobacterium sp. Leaf104]|uniref:hypothetical protein n=1 Tax=Methylobacterium TaxID=407 RepID=UPI0006F85555|nr:MULTISPECIES: hypothetical protein [Methylobacterium]KQP42531.1 hypothetical protein ASF49_01385 [Methylobacterium sp. Leaf104]MCI9878926.1 hypothetical protein [Methylobacterium goesingense]